MFFCLQFILFHVIHVSTWREDIIEVITWFRNNTIDLKYCFVIYAKNLL
jgi:hypothetical protein